MERIRHTYKAISYSIRICYLLFCVLFRFDTSWTHIEIYRNQIWEPTYLHSIQSVALNGTNNYLFVCFFYSFFFILWPHAVLFLMQLVSIHMKIWSTQSWGWIRTKNDIQIFVLLSLFKLRNKQVDNVVWNRKRIKPTMASNSVQLGNLCIVFGMFNDGTQKKC